jgi:predicted nuclease of predicted toxin-antitoxin system
VRVLLDECVDARLRDVLGGQVVQTVPEAGLSTLDDGQILAAAPERCDVFITIDKGIEHQQNWRALPFAIVIVRVPLNQIDFYRPLVPELLAAIERAYPGELTQIGPIKKRKAE